MSILLVMLIGMIPAAGTLGGPQIATPCLRHLPNDGLMRAECMEASAKRHWKAPTDASLHGVVLVGEAICSGALTRVGTLCRGRGLLHGCIRGPIWCWRAVIRVLLSSGRGCAALWCLLPLAGMHFLHELAGVQLPVPRCLGKWRMAKFEGTAMCLGLAATTPRGHLAKLRSWVLREFGGPLTGLGRGRAVCGGGNKSASRRETRTLRGPWRITLNVSNGSVALAPAAQSG